MRCSRAFGRLLYSSALLLPFAAVADSQLQTGVRGPLSASAHVRFRIIIPRTLAVDTVKSVGASGVPSIAIMSNSRNVALTATLGPSGEAQGRVILSAAARKTIAQDAPCALGAVPKVGERLVCTVSIP